MGLVAQASLHEPTLIRTGGRSPGGRGVDAHSSHGTPWDEVLT